MLSFGRRLSLAALAAASVLATGGCSRAITYTGYVPDASLTSTVSPGVDNRESVLATLGRPTFEGQFDQNDWYYVSRQSRSFAFGNPRPVAQDIIHIRFDQAGNVQSVDNTGLDQIVRVDPWGRTTPTLGRDRSFLQELFGNIGRVGAPGAGGFGNDGSNTGRGG